VHSFSVFSRLARFAKTADQDLTYSAWAATATEKNPSGFQYRPCGPKLFQNHAAYEVERSKSLSIAGRDTHWPGAAFGPATAILAAVAYLPSSGSYRSMLKIRTAWITVNNASDVRPVAAETNPWDGQTPTNSY